MRIRLDMGVVSQHGQVTGYSILSLATGLVADIDIGADAYRWLGTVRYCPARREVP